MTIEADKEFPVAFAPHSDAEHAPLSHRQQAVRALFDTLASEQETWYRRNRAFHEADRAYLRFLIPEGSRVLEIGCGNGNVLGLLKPVYGVGIDLSPVMIERARSAWPHLEFHVANAEDPAELAVVGGVFDYILLSNTIGFLDDIEKTLWLLHRFATSQTRLVVSYRSRLWEPVLRLAGRLGLKMPQNVPAKSALLASITFGLTLALISALGGVIWVLETLQKKLIRKHSC